MLERIINSTISNKNLWHAKNRRIWTACADVAHIHHSTSTPFFPNHSHIMHRISIFDWFNSLKKMGKIWNATHDPAWWTYKSFFYIFITYLICFATEIIKWAEQSLIAETIGVSFKSKREKRLNYKSDSSKMNVNRLIVWSLRVNFGTRLRARHPGLFE